MKKLKLDVPIEFYKGKRNKFWSGLIWGFVLGYIPYVVHMNQLLK
jgi:hypothetical protein